MLLALLFGSLVGMTLGLLGGGGSALAVPLLAYGMGLPPREAIATSLLVVGLAAVAGAIPHWRQGTIDLPIAITFGLLGALGSAGGAQMAKLLPPAVQMLLFALTMVVSAGFMLRDRSCASPAAAPHFRQPIKVALAALGSGLLTGVAGVGGGFVILPLLVVVGRMPIHRAIGTTLVVIFSNAFGGVVSYLSYVTLTGSVLVPFTLGAVLAAVAGTFIGRQIEERKLQSAFALGLLIVGLATIAREGLVIWAS